MSAAAGGGGGAGATVRQGHLRKLKTMKKKFFVLRAESVDCSARLEYYESEKKFRAGAIPRRVLPLKSCYNITRRLDLKQKHVIALFTREEQFCIVAENEQDLHAWLSALLKQHHSDDASDELLHPIQHVWQVNVQKKGLGAEKNIHGLYNLCLTDKTLTLVKIKSHNNVISEIGIPERVEYSLKNIRRCGDSECFFYMEVGRQTTTGAGELWMHSDDSNIAQSMHSTIYHAMRNCAKESEHERDHIQIPKNEHAPPARRQTYSDGRGRAGLAEKGLCVGSCIRQCVCAATPPADEAGAAPAPPAPHAEYQPNNPLTEGAEARVIKHHRTVSLPSGCPSLQEPLCVAHERTRSAPLTGAELDTAAAKALHSCRALNGADLPRKSGARRASTGMRLSKLSPAHSKNALQPQRGRSETMPSKMSSSYEIERPTPRHNDHEGSEASRDETDTTGEWSRTPRIPEEPDVCDVSKDLFKSFLSGSMSVRPGGSVQHSRTSSMGADDAADADGYLAMVPHDPPAGYLPMLPRHDPQGGLISASSGSVCSGTPSTDPRFSEYQLEPAWSHIGAETRPPRAYSVGSRPAPRPEGRHRAYSVGARARPTHHHPHHHPHHPRASAEDLMLLDFSNNSPAPKAATPSGAARTPPHGARAGADEYVDMSPRNAGYVEMKPGELAAPAPAPDGYMEMTYGRTRPIAIAAARAPPPPHAASPDDRFRRKLESRTAHGSQIFEFSGSLESPLSPEAGEPGEVGSPDEPHHLATVREAAEEPRRSPDSARRKELTDPVVLGSRQPAVREVVSCSPQYVQLKPAPEPAEPPCNPTSNKCLARIDSDENKGECGACACAPVVVAGAAGGAARFSVAGAPLNYAALDLEPRRAPAAPHKRTYTQIDFVRSEKLHAADAT